MIQPRETRLLLSLPPGPRLLYTKPSARDMAPATRARYRTEAFKRWLRDAGQLAQAQRPLSFPNHRPLEVLVEIHPPKDNRFDFGDRREAVLMLLDELGIATSVSAVAGSTGLIKFRWVGSSYRNIDRG